MREATKKILRRTIQILFFFTFFSLAPSFLESARNLQIAPMGNLWKIIGPASILYLIYDLGWKWKKLQPLTKKVKIFKQKNKSKDFLWFSLRIAFGIMIGIWIFLVIFEDIKPTTIIGKIFAIVWITTGVYVFVASIIHLTKHKEKAFAITSLVISSILILLFVDGMLSGIFSEPYYVSEDGKTADIPTNEGKVGIPTEIIDEDKSFKPDYNLQELEQLFHKRINEQRAVNSLSVLRWDEYLAEIARKHSQDMAKNGFLSHISSDGRDIDYRYRVAGYKCKIPFKKSKDEVLYLTGGEDINYHPIIKYIYKDTGKIAEYYTEEEIVKNIINEWKRNEEYSDYYGKAINKNARAQGIGVAMSKNNEIYVTQNLC